MVLYDWLKYNRINHKVIPYSILDSTLRQKKKSVSTDTSIYLKNIPLLVIKESFCLNYPSLADFDNKVFKSEVILALTLVFGFVTKEQVGTQKISKQKTCTPL